MRHLNIIGKNNNIHMQCQERLPHMLFVFPITMITTQGIVYLRSTLVNSLENTVQLL